MISTNNSAYSARIEQLYLRLWIPYHDDDDDHRFEGDSLRPLTRNGPTDPRRLPADQSNNLQH